MDTLENTLTKIGLGRFHIFLVIAMGLIHSSDAMEMLILAFLGPILNCYWKINVVEISLLTSSVFIGMIIGSASFGRLSDRYGRKPTIILSNVGLAYAGIISALSPTIYWMIIMRGFIGVFIGGNMTTIYAIQTEMTPVRFRGTIMIVLQSSWPIGSYLLTTLNLIIMPVHGWRVFLICSTFSLFLVLVAIIWIPESPRFLLLQNDKIKCLQILNTIASINKSEPVIDVYEPPVAKSSILDLIHPNYLWTTLSVGYMWFVAGLTYYGLILFITIINGLPHRCLQDMATFSRLPNDYKNYTIDDSCCLHITWAAYQNMYISTTGEIVFIPISIVLINLIGRKKSLSFYLFIISLMIFLLNLCLSPFQLNLLLFFTRGSAHAYFTVISLYTTEVFPTSTRSLGLGFCNMCGRTGALISPYIVNIMITQYSFMGGTLLIIFLNILAIVVVLVLPYETKDRQLFQTADHEIESIDLKKSTN